LGEEANKDILDDSVIALMEDEVGEITDLEFSKNEHLLAPRNWVEMLTLTFFAEREAGIELSSNPEGMK